MLFGACDAKNDCIYILLYNTTSGGSYIAGQSCNKNNVSFRFLYEKWKNCMQRPLARSTVLSRIYSVRKPKALPGEKIDFNRVFFLFFSFPSESWRGAEGAAA